MNRTIYTCLLLCCSLIAFSQDQVLVAQGSPWRFLDDGSNQDSAWRRTSFDDAGWKTGNTELGYGDGDEATVVASGPSANKFVTTYFRKKITVTNLQQFSGYQLRLRRDDGAVVYLNGKEVWRSNMPSGTIAFNTLASTAASDDGRTVQTRILPANALVNGENTLCVEIHQASVTNADISFSLELIGTTFNEVRYQWSGAIQPGSAMVAAKMSLPSATCRLMVSTSNTFTNSIFSEFATASAANNLMAKMQVNGLAPGTHYFYAIQSNGYTDRSSDDIGSFTTPAAGPFSYHFTVGSCAVSSSHNVYNLMSQKTPLFHLATGDFHYANPNSATDINVHRLPYEQNMLSKTASRNFLKNTAIAYTWDDHDFCGNDGSSLSAGRANARQAYREYVPHYPLAAGAGNVPIYQAFTIGRIHFILSDLRSERIPANTLMGAAQKQWFKEQCLWARNNNLMIAWVTPVSFGGNRTDNWGGFLAERTELSNFFRDSSIRNMFLLSGDAHMLAIDNGSNHDFSTGQNNPFDYPVFQAAAVNNTGSTKGGVYSEGGTFPNPNSSTGQYGLVEVKDNGGDSISIKFTGFRTAGNTMAESVLTSYTFTRVLSPAFQASNTIASLSARTLNEGRAVQLAWASGGGTVVVARQTGNGRFATLQQSSVPRGIFTDNNPSDGWNTYQLRNDRGKVVATQSIFIKGNTTLQLAPNPAQVLVHLQVGRLANASASRYMVYDSHMRTVLQGNLSLPQGSSSQPIDISGLPAGIYYVHLVINGTELVQHLSVVR